MTGAVVLILASCGEDAGLAFDRSGDDGGGGTSGVAGAAGAAGTVSVASGGIAWEFAERPSVTGGSAPEVMGGSGGEPVVFDLESEYVESPCPPVEHEPAAVLPCDPFSSPSGCAAGEGCYPMALYPADPCSPEIFGTECAPSGTGVQGEPCGGDPDCQSGFACVVSSFGTECAALCPRPSVDACAPGLICSAIDVDGFGVCL